MQLKVWGFFNTETDTVLRTTDRAEIEVFRLTSNPAWTETRGFVYH